MGYASYGKRYNLSDLVDEFAGQATAAPETRPVEPARFSINNIELTGGSIDFVDTPGAPQVTAHDLSFALKDLKLRRRDQREPFLRLGDATLAGGRG